MINRRSFLKNMGLIGASQLASPLAHSISFRDVPKMMVMIELKGGSDSLNTVIPYTEQRYYGSRPNIAIQKDNILKLSDRYGLHPSLNPLMETWNSNELALVMGLGYENPNLSHFRSIDIWNTGSDSNQTLSKGWLNNPLVEYKNKYDFINHGISIGESNSGPLSGGDLSIVHIKTLNDLIMNHRNYDYDLSADRNIIIKKILKIQNNKKVLIDELNRKAKSELLKKELKFEYPDSEIGNDFKTISDLLRMNVHTPVFKITQSGYDTHSNQTGTQYDLLGQFASAINVFRKNMIDLNLWNNIVVMTYSEFGRRVVENGSAGTDHGTAASHFIMGGNVKGGFYGKYPSLVNLNENDFVHEVDYRCLYNSIINDWFNLPSSYKYKIHSTINCFS